jgi:hypothetical protein
MQTLLDEDEVARMPDIVGFRVVEDLSASDFRARYLHQRSDGLDIPDFVRLCRAERV